MSVRQKAVALVRNRGLVLPFEIDTFSELEICHEYSQSNEDRQWADWTEIRRCIACHSKKKKKRKWTFQKQKASWPPSAGVFLTSSGEGLPDGFLHSGQGLLEVRTALCQALHAVHTSQPLLGVRPSARTAVVHGVRWSCSLFSTTFYR